MSSRLEELKTALAGRYEIERELGAGGMATVYLANDVRHQRQVAVKVLRPDLAAALGPDRFLREIRIAANLNHPHILALFDSGEAEGFLYYVMPYIEGQTLRDRIDREGELPVGEAVRIIREVTDALAFAHSKGVVHRDIKPDNVMLTGSHAIVADFGVAKAVSEATGRDKLTTAGVALGTPAYMSPEQATADPHVDHRSDIYAVGAMAYELLAGRTPFTGATPQSILAAHVTQEADPVGMHRKQAGGQLEAVIMKCLAKKPADRWQTADEMLPHLDLLATSSGGLTPTSTRPLTGWSAPSRGPRWRVLATGVIAIAAIVLLSRVFLFREGTNETEVTLDPERVVVAVLRNETGDASLDPIGKMAANWITLNIMQAGTGKVVEYQSALQSYLYVESQVAAGRVTDPIRALAEETGAGIVVAGSFFRVGDNLRFQVQVSNASTGEVINALDPVTGPIDDPDVGINVLSQRVMGSLAVSLDERLAPTANATMRPPTLAAFRAFNEGMELYIADYRDTALGGNAQLARARFLEAFRLDTTFAVPLIFASIQAANALNERAERDSLAHELDGMRDRLSEYHRNWIDFLLNYDDAERGLEFIERAARLAPGSKAVYNYALTLNRLGRYREAIDALRTLDPARGPMRGWTGYYNVLGMAYHALDLFEDELEVGARQMEVHGEDGVTSQMRAHLALGRLDTVLQLIEGMSPDRPGWTAFEERASVLLQELRAHSHDSLAALVEDSLLASVNRRGAPPDVRHQALIHELFDWEEIRAWVDTVSRSLAAHDSVLYPAIKSLLAARDGDLQTAEVYLDTVLGTIPDGISGELRESQVALGRSLMLATYGDQAGAVANIRIYLGPAEPAWRWTLTHDGNFPIWREGLAGYEPFERLLEFRPGR